MPPSNDSDDLVLEHKDFKFIATVRWISCADGDGWLLTYPEPNGSLQISKFPMGQGEDKSVSLHLAMDEGAKLARKDRELGLLGRTVVLIWPGLGTSATILAVCDKFVGSFLQHADKMTGDSLSKYVSFDDDQPGVPGLCEPRHPGLDDSMAAACLLAARFSSLFVLTQHEHQDGHGATFYSSRLRMFSDASKLQFVGGVDLTDVQVGAVYFVPMAGWGELCCFVNCQHQCLNSYAAPLLTALQVDAILAQMPHRSAAKSTSAAIRAHPPSEPSSSASEPIRWVAQSASAASMNRGPGKDLLNFIDDIFGSKLDTDGTSSVPVRMSLIQLYLLLIY